jgi:hypothetical protein|eukprot:COSAG06_NODE_1918_length_8067_cov_10.737952_2_plen_35_part_00
MAQRNYANDNFIAVMFGDRALNRSGCNVLLLPPR